MKVNLYIKKEIDIIAGMLKKDPASRGLNNLKIASEMYKTAFLIKKARFAQINPKLSEAELIEKTADYFRQLKK